MRSSLATFLDDFRRHGDATALVAYRGNRRLASTWIELATLADRFAAELMRREIPMGERVVLWGQNGLEWMGAFFGCLQRGVIVVPLDPAGALDFAQRVIENTRPKLIVGDRELLGSLSGTVPALAFEDFAQQLPQPSGADLRDPALTLDTPFQILFTSGTTAEPKGIVHTHRNVLASLDPIEREMQKYLKYERPFHPIRFLHTLPLSHVFGQFMGCGFHPCWPPKSTSKPASRRSASSRPSTASASPSSAPYRASSTSCVRICSPSTRASPNASRPPPAKEPGSAGGVSAKFIASSVTNSGRLSAAAPRCPPIWRASGPALGFALVQGYGMTETSALITLNHPFKPGQGTIGKVLPGRDVRITDEGEILVRGDMVSRATWQQGSSSPERIRVARHRRPRAARRSGPAPLRRPQEPGHRHALRRQYPPRRRRRSPQRPARRPGLRGRPAAHFRRHRARRRPALPRHPAKKLSGPSSPPTASSPNTSRSTSGGSGPSSICPAPQPAKSAARKVTEWVNAQQTPGVQRRHLPIPLLSLVLSISHASADHAGDDARLSEDLGLDSLGRVQLQSELEQRLGLTLDDATLEQVITLGDLRRALGLDHAPDHAPDHAGAAAPETSRAHPAAPPRQPPHPADQHETDIYPHWPWWGPVWLLRAAYTELIQQPLVRFLARPRVQRPAYLQPGQPVLLIANHVTAYDMPLVLYGLPGPMRRHVAAAMAGNILWDWRHMRNVGPSRSLFSRMLDPLGPLTWFLVTALVNVFPLPRSAGFRRSFQHAGEALDRGYNVLVFPEGHRTETGLQPFRPGIGILVRESKAPVVPVALAGLSELKEKGKGWFRSGALTVRIGQAIQFSPSDTPEQITERLYDTLKSMLSQE